MEDKHANSAHVVVKPRPGVSEEQACDIRARAWAYVFECFARHQREAGTDTKNSDVTKLANKERRPAV